MSAKAKKSTVKKATTTKRASAKKATVKRTTAKKSTKKTAVKKTAAKKKVAVKKAPVKKVTAKKKPLAKKKTTTKKIVPKTKKTVAKKAPVKKIVTKKGAVTSTAKRKSTISSKKTVDITLEKPSSSRTDELLLAPEPYEVAPGEEYMSAKQLEHFHLILQKWKQELMEEVDRTVSHMQDESTTALSDPNDRASREEEFSLELRTRDRERKLIRKIDEAIYRIANNEYGDCDNCGVPIGVRRLEARPTATLCIDCKTLAELREKQGSI